MQARTHQRRSGIGRLIRLSSNQMRTPSITFPRSTRDLSGTRSSHLIIYPPCKDEVAFNSQLRHHQTAVKPLVFQPRTSRLLFTLNSIEVSHQVQTRERVCFDRLSFQKHTTPTEAIITYRRDQAFLFAD